MKFRNVSSGDQIDPYWRIGWPCSVVQSKPFSDIVGPDSDDRIRGGLIVECPTEKFHTNEPFREVVIVPCKSSLDDKLEEVSASIAAGKAVAGQDYCQFGYDRGGLFCREVARLCLCESKGHFLLRPRKAKV